MRCRIHPSDPGAGVCACCLRERLSALSVAPHEGRAGPASAIRKKLDSSWSPPELPCPLSTFPDFVDQRPTDQVSHGGGRKSCAVKFSILNPLWGKNTPKKVEINDGVLKPAVSNVRLSALIRPQRVKKTNKSTSIQPAAEDESRGRSRKPHKPPGSGRGMSPASNDETDEERHGPFGPSPLKRKVAAPQPPHNAQTQQNPRSVSSFAMCLNPVVRPSQGHRRSHGSAQTVAAGEFRETIVRRCGGGATAPDPFSVLVPNRSRKLVDLGKIW